MAPGLKVKQGKVNVSANPYYVVADEHSTEYVGGGWGGARGVREEYIDTVCRGTVNIYRV